MGIVRISVEAHAALRSLADLEGRPMQATLDQAIEHYRRTRFWHEVEAAARNARQDKAAWGEEREERLAWDATLADDQDSEGGAGAACYGNLRCGKEGAG